MAANVTAGEIVLNAAGFQYFGYSQSPMLVCRARAEQIVVNSRAQSRGTKANILRSSNSQNWGSIMQKACWNLRTCMIAQTASDSAESAAMIWARANGRTDCRNSVAAST